MTSTDNAATQQIDYYSLEKVESESFMALFGESVVQIQSIVGEIMNVENDNDDKFVQSMALYHMAVAVFSDDSLSKFLKLLSRLPVFSRDFEELLSQKSNLECLNILKKLNECRMFLHAVTLSDIVSADGHEITINAWNGTPEDRGGSKYQWP